MMLKDAPVGATVHICSMFYVGDFKVLRQDQEKYSTECAKINGATAEEMEYFRRGEVPPASYRTYRLFNGLDATLVE